MSNSFYNKTNAPSPNSPGSSAQIRNEFDLVYQAFNKMPVLSLANANKLVAINSTGNGLTQVNSLTGIGGIDNTPIGATTPSTGSFTNLLASGVVNLGLAVAIGGGTINNSIIGGVTPNAAYFTTAAASSGFTGNLTGNVTGNLTGNVAGNVTGNIASSGTSTFNNLTITGTLDMSSGTAGTITGLSAPTNASDAATKQYVDTADALKLNLAGGTMSGEIAMGGNRITGMANPSSAQDAATKTYVDTADALKLNLSGGTLTGALAMSGNKITGLGTPTASTDAANKAYVDNAIQGLDAKASVRVASTANLNLTGTQTVDGVALVVGDRVLVKNQDTPASNGLYTVSSGTWTRTTDGDTWDELVAAYVFVEDGTTNGRNGFLCTITQGGTIGVTSISWVQFNSAGQIDPGNGLTKTGNRLDVATASADRIVVNPDNIDLAVTGISAGTYKSVTVDIYGRVVSGGNPNSLSGYGITDAYNKTEADLLYDAKLSRSGGTMTGAIAMGNNKITGLGAPTANGDAATKLYADGKLALTGGTMSGAIAMGANKITGLADPTVAQDAVTLNYLTNLYGSTASAASSASAAATSEANALNYKNAAGVSASDAASSATAAAASYDAFDDRYLGSKTSDPTTDNDGNALIDGALYWNTALSVMKAYSTASSSWLYAYVPSDFYVAKSGDTMSGNLTYSPGTASGVAYLNSSQVLTSSSVLTFDGTNLSLASANSQMYVSKSSGGRVFSVTNTTSADLAIELNSGVALVSPTTGVLAFGVGSTEKMRLTSTGLGVGTSSPSVLLAVAGADPATSMVKVQNTSHGVVLNLSASIGETNSAVIYTQSNHDLRFGTNNTGHMRLSTSGNLGIGVIPSTWGSGGWLEFPSTAGISAQGGLNIASNAYYNSTWKYTTSAAASLYASSAGVHSWYTAPSGTAGNTLTFTQVMTLNASGNLGIGVASPGSRLQVAGTGTVTAMIQSSNGGACRLGLDSTGAQYNWVEGGSGYLRFATVDTERMRLDASGNLLIGKTSSSYSNAGRGVLELYGSTDALYHWHNATGSFYIQKFNSDVYFNNSNVGVLAFSNSGSERLRIDASGNLCVGSPNAFYSASNRGNVSISGPVSAILGFGVNGVSAGYMYAFSGGIEVGSSIGNYLGFNVSGGERARFDTSGRFLLGSTGYNHGMLNVVRNSTFNSETSAGIAISAGGGSHNVELLLGTDQTNGIPYIQSVQQGISYGYYSLRLNPNGGNVVVGAANGGPYDSGCTLTANRSGATSYTNCQAQLYSADGDVFLAFHSGGSVASMLRMVRGVGAIDAVDAVQSNWQTLRAAAFSVMSDYRIKENVVPLTGALDRIRMLKPSRFNFIEGSMSYQEGRTVDGFLAHEVQDVVPEAVMGEKDEVFEDGREKHQSLDQAKLVPLLVASVQELTAKLEAAEARISQLEGA